MNELPQEMTQLCGRCHVVVRPTDYYCYNCGKDLKPKPPDTSLVTQLLLYGGSIVLPPMGIIWGIKYMRFPSSKSQMVGFICIAITIILLVIIAIVSIQFINAVNDQVNSQMQNFMGF